MRTWGGLHWDWLERDPDLLLDRYACSPPHGPGTTAPESIVSNKPKANHALTFKLDHSSGDGHPRRQFIGGKQSVLPKPISYQIAVKKLN